ncbi:hypothetical protein [Streptomyces sp. NPDC091268]|uniref:hypothetical protein n=1 Tax=Streptomyces sp. NPDC091268 TaxID=3365979 RepID=UPI0037F39D10
MARTSGLLIVCGTALAWRLLSLPVLLRAQRQQFRTALEARTGAEAPRGTSGAVIGELAVGCAGAAFGVAALLIQYRTIAGMELMGPSVVPGQGLPLAWEFDISQNSAHVWFIGSCVLLAVGLVALWLATRRNLLAPDRTRQVGLLLRLALGSVLPVGLVLAAAVFQAVALVTSARLRAAAGPGTAAASPAAVSPAAASPAAPGPYAAATESAPAAGAPARPAPYVPTRADRGRLDAPPHAYARRRRWR